MARMRVQVEGRENIESLEKILKYYLRKTTDQTEQRVVAHDLLARIAKRLGGNKSIEKVGLVTNDAEFDYYYDKLNPNSKTVVKEIVKNMVMQ